MVRFPTILLAGALLCAPVCVTAQTAGPAPDALGARLPQGVSPVPYRILDQDRLLRESELGQEILAGIRAAEAELEAENQFYFDQLAAEERALTEARAGLTPEEFRTRADAFDARVESIRSERAQASQALARWSEGEAQRFFDAALPVLVQMMNDRGILALLKPDTLILGSDMLDVTSDAIALLDASGTGIGDDAPEAPGDSPPGAQPANPDDAPDDSPAATE
ncbi:OmpH family outer membrane protein [Pararhodobacter marinus]|uniref:OmpH family outer membrane protein n=1 Tax=Pararhodobacter marinus TaxID=2184063 RepID=UPI0035194C9A